MRHGDTEKKQRFEHEQHELTNYTNNSKIVFATEFTEENNKEKWGNLRKGER